jgi:VWFA-related protein
MNLKMPDIKVMICAPVLLFTFTAVMIPGAQQKDQREKTFQVKTELVEVRAVVTDRHGQIVEGLKKEDFELRDDNRPQEISHFSVVTSAAASEPKPGDPLHQKPTAPVPIRERLAETPGRSVLVFVDTLHLSTTSLMLVKQQLRRFVDEQLTEQDLVALVPSAGTLGLAEQFSRDRQFVRYAIERLSIEWTSPWGIYPSPSLAALIKMGDRDALGIGVMAREFCGGLDSARCADIVLDVASWRRNAAFVTLKAVLAKMSQLPGQRLLVIFSDGFTIVNNRAMPEITELKSVITAAARSGVTIYSIYAKGLQPPASANIAFHGSRSTHLESVMSSAEFDAQAGINTLAWDTGGGAYYNTNDLSGAFADALDRNRVYYSLAYYLPDSTDRNRTHRISVRVRDHPEYSVRAPKYYQAAETNNTETKSTAKTPAQRLMQAIEAPLPSTEINISATADFVETDSDNAQVSLEIHVDGDKLQYNKTDQLYSFGFERTAVLYDSSGRRLDAYSGSVRGTFDFGTLIWPTSEL